MKAVRQNHNNESGMALLTVLLVMVLVSGLAAGMFAAVSMEQRAHAIDRDQTQVYSAAHGGLEKLTADLAALFLSDFSPNRTQLNALTASSRLPNMPGFEYTAPGGTAGSGYAISWTGSPGSDPVPLADSMITAGPYAGLKGLLTLYQVTVTARSTGGSGSEVRLRRGLQTVAVPVFQFGVFSDSDLTFFGGDDFDFGGRVHTNGNLWLSESAAGTLLFTDRITAYGDVHRRYLSNGLEAATNGMSGPVQILTTIGNPTSARTLRYTSNNESSVTNNRGGYWTGTSAADVTYCEGLTPKKTAPCWHTNGAVNNTGQTGMTAWTTVSQTTYGGNISNRLTGATVLRLPLVSQGATPIDLIKRSPIGESATSVVGGQRYFNMASLRILLSDRASDITSIDGVTATAPVPLDGAWRTTPPTGYGPVDATHPPIALSMGPTPVATTTPGGGSISSGLYDLRINGNINSFFLASGSSNVPLSTMALGTATVTLCNRRTATTFEGCTVAGSPGANATLTATTWSGNVSAATTGTVSAGSNRTITLANSASNPHPTVRFGPGLLWVGGVPTTCEGYDLTASPQRFTRCRGFTAVPASGTEVKTQATSNRDTGLIGGFIKIEKQVMTGSVSSWVDVTMDILNLGIGAPNQDGALCADPTPRAVLRIQRLRDNGSTGVANGCTYEASQSPYDWWPNALYDTREGNYRNGPVGGNMTLGGVMGYIALDVNNLKHWLAGTTGYGTAGTNVLNQNGYIVYFSDRRGDHKEAIAGDNAADPETGQYGFENVVNPPAADGSPTAATPILETGEDFNNNGVLDRWGETPHFLAVGTSAAAWGAYPTATSTTTQAVFNASARPWHEIPRADAGQARMNRQVLFRRALKLVRGGIGIDGSGVTSLPLNGLTVASENPVYVQGNYNASNDPVANADTETNLPAAVIADAVTILSNNWRDDWSFENPDDSGSRPATTTGYRFAVVTGKSLSFPWPSAGTPHFLFGTDGGAGNFLRMMENWRISGVGLNYVGSMVSLFTAQQATGTFKYHGTNRNVYDYANRNFKFDEDFLQPALLPPGTPMFRDINLLTFRQILRPNQ